MTVAEQMLEWIEERELGATDHDLARLKTLISLINWKFGQLSEVAPECKSRSIN